MARQRNAVRNLAEAMRGLSAFGLEPGGAAMALVDRPPQTSRKGRV